MARNKNRSNTQDAKYMEQTQEKKPDHSATDPVFRPSLFHPLKTSLRQNDKVNIDSSASSRWGCNKFIMKNVFIILDKLRFINMTNLRSHTAVFLKRPGCVNWGCADISDVSWIPHNVECQRTKWSRDESLTVRCPDFGLQLGWAQ
jgi:hypothetical protein